MNIHEVAERTGMRPSKLYRIMRDPAQRQALFPNARKEGSAWVFAEADVTALCNGAWWTVAQVAEYLKVRRQRVHQMMHEGKFPSAEKRGKLWYIRRGEVERIPPREW